MPVPVGPEVLLATTAGALGVESARVAPAPLILIPSPFWKVLAAASLNLAVPEVIEPLVLGAEVTARTPYARTSMYGFEPKNCEFRATLSVVPLSFAPDAARDPPFCACRSPAEPNGVAPPADELEIRCQFDPSYLNVNSLIASAAVLNVNDGVKMKLAGNANVRPRAASSVSLGLRILPLIGEPVVVEPVMFRVRILPKIEVVAEKPSVVLASCDTFVR
jgi:hypothetical protein